MKAAWKTVLLTRALIGNWSSMPRKDGLRLKPVERVGS